MPPSLILCGFTVGRLDAMEATAVTPDGRLPDADKGSSDKTYVEKALSLLTFLISTL